MSPEADAEDVAEARGRGSVGEIVERLATVGLTDQEARAYVHLIRSGASKASDVASALRLQRTETYRTLQALVDRGFASASLARPTKYEARSPDKLFGELIRDKVAQTRSLLQAQTRLVPQLMSLMDATVDVSSASAFRIIQGRHEAYRNLDRMVRNAKEDILILTTHPSASGMLETIGVWDLLRQRAREGVSVKVILARSDKLTARTEAFASQDRFEIRATTIDEIMRLFVVDGREILQFLVSDASSKLTSEHDVAVWTTASTFARTQRALFRCAWDQATPFP